MFSVQDQKNHLQDYQNHHHHHQPPLVEVLGVVLVVLGVVLVVLEVVLLVLNTEHCFLNTAQRSEPSLLFRVSLGSL